MAALSKIQLLTWGRMPTNTFIGGVSGSITTAAQLATKLEIPEAKIQYFKITGANIQCRIIDTYTLNSARVIFGSEITYYKNIGGKLQAVFGNVFPAACVNLDEFYTDYPTTIGSSIFENSKIKKLTANFTTALGSFALRNCTELIELNMSTLTSVGANALISCIKLPSINSPIQTGGFGINSLTLLTYINLEHTFSTSRGELRSATSLKTIYAPNWHTMVSSTFSFDQLTSLELFDMKKLVVLGDPAVHTPANSFTNVKMGCLFKVNIALKTANAGSPHVIMAWLKSTRGATVEFYNNDGTYNSTL